MPIGYLENLPKSSDVVVVGAGIVGAATAFHAARAGMRPVVLEARHAPATLTTPSSTGAFRLQFDNLEELEVVRESVELFENFEEVTAQSEFDPSIRRNGYLWCTTTDAGAARQRSLVEMQHRWGQTDIEIIDGSDLAARFAHVSADVVQARFRAGDGFLDPVAVTHGLLASSGAGVVLDCEVESLTASGDRIVGLRTVRGEIQVSRVVVAAGPFSARLAATVGVDLPVAAVPRQKLVFPVLPEIPPFAPMTIDDDTGTHWRPFLDGAAVLFTDPETPPGEPSWSVPPDPDHAVVTLDPASPASVARVTPLWKEVWRRGVPWETHTGQYVVTPDHRPLLGAAGPDGLYVNTGYSGHGIMGSPAGSRHLVDVMTQTVSEAENPFAVGRVFIERPRDLL